MFFLLLSLHHLSKRGQNSPNIHRRICSFANYKPISPRNQILHFPHVSHNSIRSEPCYTGSCEPVLIGAPSDRRRRGARAFHVEAQTPTYTTEKNGCRLASIWNKKLTAVGCREVQEAMPVIYDVDVKGSVCVSLKFVLPIPFLPLSPRWCKFQNKPCTEILTQ